MRVEAAVWKFPRGGRTWHDGLRSDVQCREVSCSEMKGIESHICFQGLNHVHGKGFVRIIEIFA